MRAGARGAAGVALTVLPAILAAQQQPPLVTDRPDQTESPVVVRPGYVQLEAGALHEVGADSAAGRLTEVGSVLARIGLAGAVELRLGFLGWQRAAAPGAEPARGFSDLSVGFKVALREGEGLSPSAAVIGTMLVPVGQEALRAEGVDPEVRLAIAHDLGGAFSLGYNLGAAWATTVDGAGTASTHVAGLYTLVLARSFGGRVGAFVEAFGTVTPSDEHPSSHGLNGGITFGVRPNLQLDASVGMGLDRAGPEWFAGLGIAVRLPR
jgi:hypothetical protein